MKCPECVKEGKRSTVSGAGWGYTTAMYCPPYYDEDGRLHTHDRNFSTTKMGCSNGHEWRETSDYPKCWCGWPENEK